MTATKAIITIQIIDNIVLSGNFCFAFCCDFTLFGLLLIFSAFRAKFYTIGYW
jgi:hypothetical protein